MGNFNGVFAGAFAAWCVTYLLLGAYFVGAYVARRKDEDFLVFGLLTFALAVHSAGLGLHYADPAPERWAIPHVMANGGGLIASVLAVHFAMHVHGTVWRRRALWILYPTTAALLLPLVATQSWFDLSQAHATAMSFMGHDVWVIRAPVRALGVLYLVFVAACVGLTTALLGLALRDGKREVLGAFVGIVLLCGAVAVDVTGTLRAARWVHVTPHVFIAFAFGVASTLLGRYRSLSRALQERTAELEHRTGELTTLCQELSDVQGELVRGKQLAALGEMAAVVAHEVRNPLAVLQNALSGLRKPTVAVEDRNTLLRILEEEIARLNAVVGGLLTYVKPLQLGIEAVDLCELMYRATAGVDDARITVEIHSDVDETWLGDPTLLRRAVDNLVANATQAMVDGGTLTISLRRQNGGCSSPTPASTSISASTSSSSSSGTSTSSSSGTSTLLSVADTGVGMTPDVAEKARRPFFTTRATGTGLGLAIVDRIAEAHGGHVEIDSAPARGTRVTLVLPDRKDDERGRLAPGAMPRAKASAVT